MNRFVLLLFLFSLVLTGCSSQKTIVNGLDEREANEIIVFLSNKGIQSTKAAAAAATGGGGPKIQLYDIQVPAARSTEAMAMLNIAGLPRKRGESLLQIFAGGGLVPSQLEEKIRYQRGLAQDVANTIRKIDGVLDTDVILSFPEEDPLNPEKNVGQTTASVYVKHSGILDDPNSHMITKIRRLVASSITGLSFDNVTVIGDRARFTNLSPESSNKPQLVSIWSVLLAPESVRRFQIIFFSFLILLSLLLMLLAWSFWKFHTIIKNAGGLPALFSFSPLKLEDAHPPVVPSTNEEVKEGANVEAPPEVKTEEKPKGEG